MVTPLNLHIKLFIMCEENFHTKIFILVGEYVPWYLDVYLIIPFYFVELFYNRDIIFGWDTRSGMSILCVVRSNKHV